MVMVIMTVVRIDDCDDVERWSDHDNHHDGDDYDDDHDGDYDGGLKYTE